jgi:hypothetical protein
MNEDKNVSTDTPHQCKRRYYNEITYVVAHQTLSFVALSWLSKYLAKDLVQT